MNSVIPQAIDLKGKELAFALAYIALGPVRGRITQAAVKAGFPKAGAATMGSRLLKKVEVAAYVRAREGVLIKHAEEKQLVTREWIIEQLKKVYAQSMIGEPEMKWIDGEMQHTGLYTFNDRGANRALELLGKTIGMFSDKKDDKAADAFNLTINLGESQPKGDNKIAMKDVTPANNQLSVENPPSPSSADLPTINLDAPHGI